MAQYPSRKEITDVFTSEELDAKIGDLPSYRTGPVPLASLHMENLTPEIILAWGALCRAIMDAEPATLVTATTVSRPLTPSELRDAVIGMLQADEYDRRQAAEKEAKELGGNAERSWE